ncbi:MULTISPECIES: DUF6957 family protein [Alteromonadales]|uniref:DUF6957 domain-containing protein n=1 Tax=Thalassotalea marina TaxID=1673741 RepID=A0A919BFB2_9GAMM|nr:MULTISPECIES: hypothetical protein [Alteromonadales]MDE3273092.1 hypothetical protein [Pseudoalteromonas sp. G4]TMS79668.1 nucleotide exchange factor GrpE [Pseudoalteromonas sp. S554]GHF88229.1 hypothetical protein GCM10017161_14870 [Thalassotalea marina]
MTDEMKQELTRLAGVLSEPGVLTNFGCLESQIELMKLKCEHFSPNKPICVVKDWAIWDIEPPQSAPDCVISLIKADYIIYDELDRFPVGGWVRTTAIISIHENCIFATNNTNYILVGSGTRKNVEFKDMMKFF